MKRFYAQDELDILYSNMKKKKLRDKEEWEVFVEQDRVRQLKQKRRVYKNEIPIDYIDKKQR